LHKNESAQIAELKARVGELEAQNLKLKVGWNVEAVGAIVLACVLRPYRALRDLIIRITRSGYVNQGTDPEVEDQAVLVEDQA
jgi:hypothetical protein